MFTLLVLPLALATGCDKVPLLAPTGSVITLMPSAFTVSLNSELSITATVIENGVSSGGSGSNTTRAGSGTPVQNGTLVTFTTTIGRIEPSEARTHNGQVTVKLITGTTSGNPTITAYSGGASTTNKDISIGTAAVKGISVSATPQTLPAAGGSSQITATVGDTGGGPLGGIPVNFTATKGSVSPSSAVTDGNGVATVTLTTSATTDVTATTGQPVVSGKITITVNPPGIKSFTASTNATTSGAAVTFTVTPSDGVTLSNVRVNFGDGRSTDLGLIAAAATAPHTYCSPGSYTAVATASDTLGGTSSLNTTVIIGALPVTLNQPSPAVGSPVTFTAGGTTSAQVSRYVWAFDDGTPETTTTAPQIVHTFTTRGLKTIRVDVFGVSGCQIGTATATVDVQ